MNWTSGTLRPFCRGTDPGDSGVRLEDISKRVRKSIPGTRFGTSVVETRSQSLLLRGLVKDDFLVVWSGVGRSCPRFRKRQ